MAKYNLMKKSVDVIKKLQMKNGGILASPQGEAYPYVYIRDAVIMTKALNRMGECKCSEEFYYFVEKFSKIDKYGEIFHRYNKNGLPCVTRKTQNDNEGLVLHGIYDTYLHSKKRIFLENLWPLVEKIVGLVFNYSKTGLVKTRSSIHEFYRLENGYDVWANSACCRGLLDAAKIAEIMNHKDKSEKWKKKAEEIKKNMDRVLFDKKLGVYMKTEKLKGVPDISQTAPFYFGIEPSRIKLRNTVDYLRKYLWHKEIGGYRRFRKFEIVEDPHWYTGGSGSWVAFTCFMSRFNRVLGRKNAQKECVDWVEKIAEQSKGLLPEHISTKVEYEDWKRNEIEFNERLINGTRRAERMFQNSKDLKKENLIYWATPLGWAHAEYILTKKEEFK